VLTLFFRKLIKFFISFPLKVLSVIFYIILFPVKPKMFERLPLRIRTIISKIVYEIARVQLKSSLYNSASKTFELSTKIQNKPIKKELFVFEAYKGRQYACSPKALYEHLIKTFGYGNYSFIWIFRNVDKHSYLLNNPNTKLIKYNTWAAIQSYREAKYIITNSLLPYALFKQPNQILVQCWHGTPFKKIGLDVKVKNNQKLLVDKETLNSYNKYSLQYDFFLSPSKFASEKFISAFNLTGHKKENIILEKGYPRNDYLIKYKNNPVNNIKTYLNIPQNKKIILYAPTWRDDQISLNKGFKFTSFLDFEKLKPELESSYIILLRAHYLISESLDYSNLKDFVYNVSNVDDINDLYLISDLLITDYSSAFFDYALLERPIIFYMPDYSKYKNQLRDFYLSLENLPSNIITNQKELPNEIINFYENNGNFHQNITNFNKAFNTNDDGNASERVIDILLGRNDNVNNN